MAVQLPACLPAAAACVAHPPSRSSCACLPACFLFMQIAEGCVKVFVKQTDALTALCLQVGATWHAMASPACSSHALPP